MTNFKIPDFVQAQLDSLTPEELERIEAEKKAQEQELVERHKAQAKIQALKKTGLPTRFIYAAASNPDDVCSRFLRRRKMRNDALKTISEIYDVQGKEIELETAQKTLARSCSCSLIIHGKVGSHKTHTATTIAKACLDKGLSVWFITAVDLLGQIKRTFDKNGTNEYENILNRAKTVDVLILDDFGKELASNWAVSEIIFTILNTRYDEYRDTIITTQYKTEDDLIEHLTSRDSDLENAKAIVRRIYEKALVLDMNSKKAISWNTKYTDKKHYAPIQESK